MKKIFLYTFSAIIAFSSCKKISEKGETDLIAGDIALSTTTNCEQAIIGAYAAMVPQMDILLNSTMSDELRVAEFYNAQTTHEWQFSPTDVTIRDNLTAINPLYAIVDRANRVLAALPRAKEESPTDAAKKNRLRGEALFLRAYALFDAFRFYGQKYSPTGLGMPYPEAPSLSPQARLKADAFFTKLYTDINAAKPLLPTALTDKNRATLAAAQGLLARVALYKGDWATAETEATAYIAAIPLADIATFPSIWTDMSTAEVAFQVVRTPSIGARLGSIFRAVSPTATNLGTITWAPSNKLWSSFPAGDVRFSSYLRDEPLLIAQSRPSRIVHKYRGTGYATPGENVNNVKLMRTAEMVLIRAEARAEQSRFTGANSAETDYNMLRMNRVAGHVPVTFANQAAAINAIMDERYLELCFEGHRFWDLRRRGLPVTRLATDAPNANAVSLPANNFRFSLPIPQTEMNANPLMQQNPGF